MDLTKLAGRPELTVSIGGKTYCFSELPVEKLADLQSFIRATVPHPLDVIKPHLNGLSAEDRRQLLDLARIDAKDWPPRVGTSAGALALLSTEPGQIKALHVGLSVHQPDTTETDARRVYKALRAEAAAQAKAAKAAGRNDSGEGTVQRIFACLFGLNDPALNADDHHDDDHPEREDGLPKG